MTQMGKVLSANAEDGTVKVEIIRQSACSSCHHKDSCGTSVIASCDKCEAVVADAKNECGAEAGDTVEIFSSDGKSILIAFSVFILPLLLGFAAYFIMQSLFDSMPAVYGVTAAVFVLSFFGLFFGVDRALAGKIHISAVRVIAPAQKTACENENQNENNN